MELSLYRLALIALLAPLCGSLFAGIGAHVLRRRTAHWGTISLMLVSFVAATLILLQVQLHGAHFDGTVYTWAATSQFHFEIGFLIDRFSAMMMMLVTFVSLLVHIYSIGYMADEDGYQRFFSYMSLFTFSMLLLILANNFMQLFIGWEGVGVASYLLIGFYFQKESAVKGSLKAFLVNRVGDFGFVLGIAAIFTHCGSLNYAAVFGKASQLSSVTMSLFPGTHCSLLTVICILLFVGAMGKSAQVPLHIWLPESMEGPTPISALIHAATMVTAGVYMVARLSPLYELSQPALSLVLVVGATGGLFLGLLAFIEFDIKRVIAYSTMSQLGYMMAANGASAFPAAIFHLLTHGFFKALLFLAAGSVILAMHHEQDMRKMGGLRRYLPVTYTTFLIGALALSAIPPFAGFYSKESVIEAVHLSNIPGSGYAYICLLLGSFVTGYYIFRAFFMTFHTQDRMSNKLREHLHEPAWSVRGPLIALAIPSLVLGALMIQPILYGKPGLLGSGIVMASQYNVLHAMADEFMGVVPMALHALHTLPFWFAVSGIVAAWLMVVALPRVPGFFQRYFFFIHRVLKWQYGFDYFNELVFVRGIRKLSRVFYLVGDLKAIDYFLVEGSGREVNRLSRLLRHTQSGYLYHYIFVMILGVLGFLIWLLF